MRAQDNPNVTLPCNGLDINNLTPSLQKFVKRAIVINRLRREFCCKDFPELKPNTFRQYVSRLKKLGWIVTVSVGTLGWYKIRGENVGNNHKKVTLEGMGVGTNMQEIINEASSQTPAMHDIKIKVPSSKLYQNVSSEGLKPNPHNKGIRLEINLERYIDAIITVYPKLAFVEISSTCKPIIYDIRGAQQFITYLKFIHTYLYRRYNADDIDDCLDWIAVHYHLNQDGQTEFSDPKFHRTISDITGGFIRVYAKKFPDKKNRLRLERIITPNCSVSTLVQDMKNIGNYLYSNNDDISHIMPSQILAFNKTVSTIQKMASLYNPVQGVFSF